MVNETGFVPIDLSVWSIAVEKCDLCDYSKRPFYCKSCINSGNFCYSTSLYHRPVGGISESSLQIPYSVKHAQWVELKRKNEDILAKLKYVHQLKNENSKKRTLIALKSKSLQLLKEQLMEKEKACQKVCSEYEILKESKRGLRKDADLVKAKITNIKDHTSQLSNLLRITDKESILATKRLGKLRRNLVRGIIDDIFPISSSTSNSESVDSMANSTHKMMNLLRDATRTAYIQGRWVYADSGWDQMYQVLTAALPGNGDYSNCWTAGSISETVKSPGELQASPALNIVAGLSFLNQMVQAFASILDIRLPFHVPLKEFYRLDLTEELFNRAVSRLNKNVATICFYQNVDRKKLHGLHTVVNILNLVKTPELGCDSPQSIKQSRINDRGFLPVGDSVFACYEDDFEDENDEEEEAPTTQTRSSADKEWEYVPSGIPNYRDSSAEHQSYFSAVATTSGIPSIVSSIWKVFSGSGDK